MLFKTLNIHEQAGPFIYSHCITSAADSCLTWRTVQDYLFFIFDCQGVLLGNEWKEKSKENLIRESHWLLSHTADVNLTAVVWGIKVISVAKPHVVCAQLCIGGTTWPVELWIPVVSCRDVVYEHSEWHAPIRQSLQGVNASLSLTAGI